MKPIRLTANPEKNGFRSPSEYTRARLAEWLKKYRWFHVEPLVSESKKQRKYLEAAVIPEYCAFQYGIDPRDPEKDQTRRFLFKRDFDSEIIKNRHGDPEKIPLSSQGKANDLTTKFTEWATENGCKVPNPDLYKLWRDEWSMDIRFDSFHDFLTFLKLDCDAMPSAETLSKLKE